VIVLGLENSGLRQHLQRLVRSLAGEAAEVADLFLGELQALRTGRFGSWRNAVQYR